QQDRLWNRHAQRFGRLEVADQLERGRLADGQFRRLGAFQNPVDVRRRVPEEIARFRAVSDERAGPGPLRAIDDRRQTLLYGQLEELRRDLVDGRVLPDEDRPIAFLSDLGEHAGELVGTVEMDVPEGDPELLCRVVRRLAIDREDARMPRMAPQHGDAGQARVELAQHLQTLAHDFGRVALHAGDVAAGLRPRAR